MAVKGNGKVRAPAHAKKQINYDDAVREGQEIIAKREADDCRLANSPTAYSLSTATGR